MKALLSIIGWIVGGLLGGCANIPGPDTPLPDPNCQVRLSEAQVTAAGYFTATTAAGSGCVFTQMGNCSHVKSISSEIARCTVELRDPPAPPPVVVDGTND